MAGRLEEARLARLIDRSLLDRFPVGPVDRSQYHNRSYLRGVQVSELFILDLFELGPTVLKPEPPFTKTFEVIETPPI